MLKSVDEINKVILELKNILPKGGIVLLKGDLAAGKTTLVKAFVQSLGIGENVSSPTFSIMNIYDNRVFHYDIYSEGVSKFIQNGLLENLELQGYHFIEWADEKLAEILNAYGFNFITVEIISHGEKREYRIKK